MTVSTTLRRAGLAPVLAGALLLIGATSAGAHIQVTPTLAAPNDPVHFTVLVPGESENETVKVELKVPADVLPFSFGTTPGWKRTLVEAPNGAVDRIVWTGRMPKDGFAEFSFLAGTPEKPTTLTWKALQTYADGQVVRWIGAPGSEQPAPITRVVRGAPAQNAGGEGAETSADAASAGVTTYEKVVREPKASSKDDIDWVARGLALAGLFAGLAAIVLALRSTSGRKGR
jgi:uncharacterized protein YcnI